MVPTKPPVTRGHINPHHLSIKFFQGYTSAECTETPVISKSANLSHIPNSTKSLNLNNYQKEQTTTENENLPAEMIALKTFAVDQIYLAKKSNDKDDELLIKTVLDQIEFLNQEPKIIKMILENYRQTIDYKSQSARETAKKNNLSDKGER